MRDKSFRRIAIMLTVLLVLTTVAGCIGDPASDPDLPPGVDPPGQGEPADPDPPETDPPKTNPPKTDPPDDDSGIPPDSWLAMEEAPWSLLYLNTDGDIVAVDLAQKTSRAIITGKRIVDFNPNWDKDIIAYMTYHQPSQEENVWLYFTQTDQTKHAFKSFMSSGMTWSPGGRYLMVDSGTDVFRHLNFFDTQTDSHRDTIAFMGGLWSPTGCCMAVAMGKDVEPPLEVHDGRTLSVYLFDPANGELTLIADGNRQVYWQPYIWDSSGLILRRDLWADFNSPQYYRYDLASDALVQTPKPRVQQPPSDLPGEIREIWSHKVSPDRNYVLFQDFDYIQGVSMVKIWSRISNKTYIVAIGHTPYWNKHE